MKKAILSILTVILAVVALAPVAAYATTQETDVCDFVKEQDKIVDAKCLVYENNCIVAIKTEKFLNKTEYDKFKEDLKQKLEDEFDFDHIVITRSPKLMHAVEEISKMSEKEREQAVKEFFENIKNNHSHRPHVEPKR